MNTSRPILSLLATIAFTASATHASNLLPDSDGILIIEAEDMQLESAEIVDFPGSSQGKAVKMLSPDSVGSVELSLPQGTYVVDALFAAPDPDTDGIFLVANGKAKRTPTPQHGNKLVYGAKFLVFESNGVDPVLLQFTSSFPGHQAQEFGMSIDHLEIVEYSKAAYRLERWTD